MSQHRVTAAKLNVRSAPAVQDGNQVGQLSNGDMIQVVGSEEGWAEFEHNGDNAYASARYLEATGDAAAPAEEETATEPAAGVEDPASEESSWFMEAAQEVASWPGELVEWWQDSDSAEEVTEDQGTGWWDDIVSWWEGRDEPSMEAEEQLEPEVAEVVEEQATEAAETPEETEGGYGYFSHPDWEKVKVSYGANAVPLNSTADRLFRSILASAGLTSGYISSTLRTYADQARINYEQNSESQILNWYGSEVHAAWVKYHNEGRSTAEFAEFIEARDARRGRPMSRHLDGLCMDLAPHNAAYAAKLAELKPVAGSGVMTYLVEKGCTHTQFTFEVC
jgi:uncharacterized protein YraI